MIKVGICGFCEVWSKYFRDFDVVEVQQIFYWIFQEKMLECWRKEVFEGFIFLIKVFQGVIYLVNSLIWRRSNVKFGKDVGLFRLMSDVFYFWRVMLKEVEIFGVRFIFIQLLKSFRESDESFVNVEKFFEMIDRGNFEIVVELRGWSEKGIKCFVREFDVIDVIDLFVRILFYMGDVSYYCLYGCYENGRIIYSYFYSDEEF